MLSPHTNFYSMLYIAYPLEVAHLVVVCNTRMYQYFNGQATVLFTPTTNFLFRHTISLLQRVCWFAELKKQHDI